MKTAFFVFLFLCTYPFFFYPILLGLLSIFRAKQQPPLDGDFSPIVSHLIIVRNGEHFIKAKIQNSLTLDYPAETMEILVGSDGSTDRTAEIVRDFHGRQVRLFDFDKHEGKIAAINKVLPHCKGEIILFSDVSSLLRPDAVKRMANWFQDSTIGGICGRKILWGMNSAFAQAQKKYAGYEDFIRQCESRLASVASNEGFLYAARRNLIASLPVNVTDDLYNAMSIVKQSKHFVYDPQVLAEIPLRAEKPEHELARRRRIVCLSMNGIWQMRSLLNPFGNPIYAWILLSHKVMRRSAPVFAIFLLTTNGLLIDEHPFFLVLFAALFGGCVLFLLLSARPSWREGISPAKKILSIWHYFCLGNLGTLLGIWDLCRGKRYERWEPLVTESQKRQ